MGAQESRVASAYELRVRDGPVPGLALPLTKPVTNSQRHAGTGGLNAVSSSSKSSVPSSSTKSQGISSTKSHAGVVPGSSKGPGGGLSPCITEGFYSPVKQASSVKTVPPKSSSVGEARRLSVKHDPCGGRVMGQVVCSATVPWLVKRAKFSYLPATGIEFGRVIDKYFVVKQLRKDSVVKHHDERHVRREKELLSTMASPFCIRLFGTFQDRGHLYLALEYVPGGELFRRLGKKKAFPPAEAKFYLTEVFCALEHVHSHGYVYRDLKPENVTLDEEGHCKLIDFGFSTPCAANERMQTICGTPAYLSPEQLDGRLTNGYTRIVDWWSFGVLLFELLTGKTPFCKSDRESPYEIFLRIIKNKLSFPRHFDVEAKELIGKLCHPTAEQRLSTAATVKAHTYFTAPWAAVAERRLIPPYVPALKDVGDCHCFDRYEDCPVVIDDSEGAATDGRFADF